MNPFARNLPNILTFSRIFLSFVFMYLLSLPGVEFKWAALITFAVASFTDYLDGRVAREAKITSAFGQLMDPIADKVLTLSAFLAFVQLDIVPAWMVVIVVVRDLMITALRFMMVKPESRGARFSGKFKTLTQFIFIVAVLIFIPIREAGQLSAETIRVSLDYIYGSMLFIVVFTLWSGIRYLMVNKDSLT